MRDKKEQVFKKLLHDISAGDIPNVLLLFGEETFLTDWAAAKLTERFVSESARVLDLTVFEPGTLVSDELADACRTLPMFSERKVVIIEAAFDITEEILEYAESISDPCLLIIKAVDSKSQKAAERISKRIAKFGKMYEFGPISGDELMAFIVKRFRAEGKQVSPQAANLLAASCGYTNKDIDYALYNLENDIKKIAAYQKGDVIGEDDVLAGLSDNVEHAVFKMLDSISDNKKDRAFMTLRDLLKSGADEHFILAVIAGQLELMLIVKQLRSEGMNKEQIAKKTKVHEFRVGKAMKFQQKYDENELKRILLSAYETDDKIKSGLLEPALALELLIAGI